MPIALGIILGTLTGGLAGLLVGLLVLRLRAAYLARVGKRIFSLWVEREHYLRNNDRVDLFLTAGSQSLAYFAENFGNGGIF